ncbi:hypothetical protein PA01_18825 [Azoarcus sp. PA01]|nr:hypothetical protein PA01_18825 [Azoarcus sp. PA01]
MGGIAAEIRFASEEVPASAGDSIDDTLRRRRRAAKEALIKSKPFGLSLSKPLLLQGMPFDKLKANGINQRFPNGAFQSGRVAFTFAFAHRRLNIISRDERFSARRNARTHARTRPARTLSRPFPDEQACFAN